MKKLTLSLMALVCALCCAFALVACNEETPGDTFETTGGNETVTIAGKTFVFFDATSTDSNVAEALELQKQMMEGSTITFTEDGKFTMTSTVAVEGTKTNMTQKGVYTFENGSGSITTTSSVFNGNESDIPEDDQSTQTLTVSDGKLIQTDGVSSVIWALQD